jgi:DNA-binding transcriptional LysR family regulator
VTSEAGAQLLAQLELALGEIGAALDVVNGFRDTPTGALRLNVPTIVAYVILPEIARDFLATYPGATLEVMRIASSTSRRLALTPASAMMSGWSRR